MAPEHVLRVQVGGGHVVVVALGHGADAELGDARPGGAHVVDLEDGHVAAIAAAPLEVAACRRPLLHGSDDLEERVADGEHAVLEAEDVDARIVERVLQTELALELVGHGRERLGGQGDLAQARVRHAADRSPRSAGQARAGRAPWMEAASHPHV
jgi:hypothetical protein